MSFPPFCVYSRKPGLPKETRGHSNSAPTLICWSRATWLTKELFQTSVLVFCLKRVKSTPWMFAPYSSAPPPTGGPAAA